MAQFDVHRAAGGTLVVDLQHDLLEALPARVVAPVVALRQGPDVIERLTPVVDLFEEPHAVMVNYLATLRRSELSSPVASLNHERDLLIRAVDTLLGGV